MIGSGFSAYLLNDMLNTQNQMTQTMTELSTGLSINSPADNPAGYQVATQMTTQIGGLNQAVQNLQDGQSLLQTANGAEGNIANILEQMQSLANQANNSSVTSSQQTTLQNEYVQLAQEMDSIASNTQYNGMSLLNGSQNSVTLHASDVYNDTLTFSLFNSSTVALGVSNLNLASSPQAALSAIDNAIASVGSFQSSYGASENVLTFSINNATAEVTNLTSARSNIQDANIAQLQSQLTAEQIQAQAQMSVLNSYNTEQNYILKLFP